MRNLVTSVAVLLWVTTVGAAQPTGLDWVKKLAGKWEGTHKTDKGEEKVPLEYDVTSGGSVVVEKISVGDPHEMVTTYFMDGKELMLTHYCAVGNQPTMKLEKKDGKSMSFAFAKGTNMTENDPHMHSLKLTLVNPDELKQEWTFYENGKLKSTDVFMYKRTK